MYGSRWSINGNAGAQSLSYPAFPSISTDSQVPRHTVYCKNSSTSVSLFVGPETPDGSGGLEARGYTLEPGESFKISLVKDQLWVAAPSGQTGSVSFLVTMD
jgi:hypothetical protein